jgi:orotate phosphoribosyltransferase
VGALTKPPLQDAVVRLLSGREGHFALESGHHGALWLELERLFLRPEAVQPLSASLAARLAPCEASAICAPLVEGAFVGLQVASALGVAFVHCERVAEAGARGAAPVVYRLPRALRREVGGRRVAVVDDVINAGSALRGVLAELAACGATPVAVGALAVLGSAADALAAEHRLPLEALARMPNEIWEPAACPLCARGVPLVS